MSDIRRRIKTREITISPKAKLTARKIAEAVEKELLLMLENDGEFVLSLRVPTKDHGIRNPALNTGVDIKKEKNVIIKL